MKALLPLALSLLLISPARAVEIVTTIKPLQLIADAITDGAANSELLLPPGTSPHDYALKPSDLRRVNNADLVIWVGPELEGFLAPLLESHPGSLALMARIEAEPHNHQEPADAHDHDHDNGKIVIAHQETADPHHDHDHGARDPHIWLDPHHGRQIAILIAARLAELDAANADRYQQNLARFEAELRRTNAEVEARLAPARGKGYFVFHDAYGYWEEHYRLPSLGYFTVNPERAPGARTLGLIHQALKDARAECVFAEPQFRPAVIEAVRRGTQARIGVLDPLAAGVESGPQGYFVFMRQMADAMAACLLNES